MKRKIAGIFLLICLAVPITVTLLFFHYQKEQVKYEVKRQIIAGIPKEELVLLQFTHAEACTVLQWEHAGEFEYNDQMYDIVAYEVRGDTSCYWCWQDDKENNLNKQIDKLLASALRTDSPQQEEHQKRLTNFFKSLYCALLPEWESLVTCKSARVTTPYLFVYSAVLFPPPFPPPRR